MALLTRIVCLLLCPLFAFAGVQSFSVSGGKEWNRVVFHSEAVLESFEGVNTRISGELSLDPDQLGAPVHADFLVDVKGFDTGISLRNQHMLSNHLHAERFPTSQLRLVSLLPTHGGALVENQPQRLSAEVDFTLHGVTRRIEVPVVVTRVPDGSQTPCRHPGAVLHVQAEFPVALADYGIPRPEFLFLKVGEQVTITFDCWAASN